MTHLVGDGKSARRLKLGASAAASDKKGAAIEIAAPPKGVFRTWTV
jgi:hypothetical protein